MTSGGDQDSQREEYLFDFLYVDRNRIASYYAQLFDHGVHTSTKTISGTNSSSSDKTSVGIPKLFGGEFKFSDAAQSSIERQYDAAWHLPLNFLRELNEQGYINRNIEAATLGEVILFHGNLQLIDLRMVQRMWEPLIELQNADLPSATSAQKKAKRIVSANQKHMVKIIENLPHTLQLRGFNPNAQVWSTLVPEHLAINPADLVFKHGACIPGEWTIVGILDATPAREDDEVKLPSGLSEIEQGMLQMMLALQLYFGRRDTDFGITPLAIYRAIQK